MKLRDRFYNFLDRALFVKNSAINRIDFTIITILAISLALIIYLILFPKEVYIQNLVNSFLHETPIILTILFFLKWLLYIIGGVGFDIFNRSYLPPLLMSLVLLAYDSFRNVVPILNQTWFLYLLLITLFVLAIERRGSQLRIRLLNPSFLFVISFITLIFVGTAMLLIPKATNGNLSLIDALFTATSAVCVTGLTTVDTASVYTPLGQNIILVLLQIGGLGLMTFTNFFTILFRGGMSFKNHLILTDLFQSDSASSLFSTLSKIVFYTFLVEILGAFLIFGVSNPNVFSTNGDAWIFSIFHSISAFCNAGFSTLPDGLYNANFRFNYEFQLVICLLVVLGGIGFPVVNDLYGTLKALGRSFFRMLFFEERFKFQARVLTVHSRLVLTTTLALLIFGGVVYFLTEYNNTLQPHSTLYGKIVQSIFGSVTPRTAGFNTVNMGQLMQGTILLYLLLMWIGASPSSTGGGIKTTTFAIGFSNVLALARGKKRVDMFKREISSESIDRAFAIMFLSVINIGISVFIISIIEPQHNLSEIAFECFSAYSTVGLSLNITPTLGVGAKIVLIFTMFLGRVGMFTLLLGIFKKQSSAYQYPKENVLIV